MKTVNLWILASSRPASPWPCKLDAAAPTVVERVK